MEEALPQNRRLQRVGGTVAILVWGFLGIVIVWSPFPRACADTTPAHGEEELADDELARSTFVTDVGLEGVYYFRDRGPRLVARPDHPDTPLSVRIVRVEPRGDASLYELRYVAQFVGRFDMRYYLMRPDLRSPTELRPMRVSVRAMLPPDFEGGLETIEGVRQSRPTRHALMLIVIGTLWIVPAFWALLRWITRKPADVAVPQGSRVHVARSREPLQTMEAP